jgi:hypothetical protein
MRTAVLSMTMAGACLALGLLATEAQAAGRRDRACVEDAKKLCSDVKPGGGRVYQCLDSHASELSPACSERLKTGKENLEAFVSACKPEAQKFCKSTQPGSGRILQCLRGHEKDLSPDCKAQFAKARSNRAVAQ